MIPVPWEQNAAAGPVRGDGSGTNLFLLCGSNVEARSNAVLCLGLGGNLFLLCGSNVEARSKVGFCLGLGV